MSKPSLLRLTKRCRLFRPLSEIKSIPSITRGLYILYRKAKLGKDHKKRFDVVYIGVAGTGEKPKRGIHGRLSDHLKKKKGWTHYSFFEVHDNIRGDEILELEGLLLHIFRYDPRIELQNRQVGSRRLKKLSGRTAWPA